VPPGEADANDDFFGAFDSWTATLWPTLEERFDIDVVVRSTSSGCGMTVEFVGGGRATALHLPDLAYGTVVTSTQLSPAIDDPSTGAPIVAKHHVEIELPEGSAYRPGDYLSVLAHNDDSQVDRVLRRFGLGGDTLVRLGAGSEGRGLPTGYPVSCHDLLAQYVELAQPATQGQVASMARLTRCPPEKAKLLELAAADGYATEVLAKRRSVIDLLDEFQSCPLSFGQYLDMLPPMRARQYSISSSPLRSPSVVSLTFSVLDVPALSGVGRFTGVSSVYLARRQTGDKVTVAVRKSLSDFHPPDDPSKPIVMVCAGSGIAPFRGFLQERAAQRAHGTVVGDALLFFGTHAPHIDNLYADELEEWAAAGVVTTFTAFSRVGDRQYVDELLLAERTRVVSAMRADATFYVCGDGQRMAPAVRRTLLRLYKEDLGVTDDEASAWAEKRYLADLFS
jgi:cytochrome P450/NADPH-cytochrome P450 reductase